MVDRSLKHVLHRYILLLPLHLNLSLYTVLHYDAAREISPTLSRQSPRLVEILINVLVYYRLRHQTSASPSPALLLPISSEASSISRCVSIPLALSLSGGHVVAVDVVGSCPPGGARVPSTSIGQLP